MVSKQQVSTGDAHKWVQVVPNFDGPALPPPEAANFFHFTISGPEVEMLVGFIDLQRMAATLAAAQSGQAKPVHPEWTHRIFLSVRGFLTLKAQVDEMTRRLSEQGVNLEEMQASISTKAPE